MVNIRDPRSRGRRVHKIERESIRLTGERGGGGGERRVREESGRAEKEGDRDRNTGAHLPLAIR